MKKFIAIILLVVTVATLVACQSDNTTVAPADTVVSTSDSSIDTEIPEDEDPKPYLVSAEEAIEAFRKDPYAQVNGYTLEKNGDICLTLNAYRKVGHLHYDQEPQGQQLYKADDYVAFLQDDVLILFVKGDITTFYIGDAKYCGWSYWCGLIFRDGSNVFAIKCDAKKRLIAENVALVIDSDYRATSDAWSQPLFLMTDGSVKVYIGWNNEDGYLVNVGEYGYDETTSKFTSIDEGGWCDTSPRY